MEIKQNRYNIEIIDISQELTFWSDGDIIISKIGEDDCSFTIPEDLMEKIMKVIEEYKNK